MNLQEGQEGRELSLQDGVVDSTQTHTSSQIQKERDREREDSAEVHP